MRESGLTQVEWPVLRFGSPNCTVLKYESGDRLENASFKTLASWSRMNEYFLIDSEGIRHNLRSPQFIDPPTGFSKLMTKMSGSARPIHWNAEHAGVVSIDEIRAMIFANFDQFENVWHAYDLHELKKRLASAKTVAEIMAVFG